MSYRYLKLRRRCEPILAQIDLPRPFSIEALCHHIAEQRGRPLYLHPLPPEAAVSGTCGLWLGTAIDDHVFYEKQTSRLHQEHIMLHEFGHILFGHDSLDAGDNVGAQALLSDLDPRLVRHLLGRTNYTTRQEQEAEMLASLIRTSADQPHLEQSSGVLAKLESALGIEASRDG
jgi:hypothetical protein